MVFNMKFKLFPLLFFFFLLVFSVSGVSDWNVLFPDLSVYGLLGEDNYWNGTNVFTLPTYFLDDVFIEDAHNLDINSSLVVRNFDNSVAVNFSGGASSGNNYFKDNVGIGDSTPDFILDVEELNAGGTATISIANTHATANSHARLRIRSQNGDAKTFLDTNSAKGWVYGMDKTDGSFKISENTDGALETTPMMTILTGGNVGIGTTSPDSKLNIFNGATVDETAVHISATLGTNEYTGIGFGSTEENYEKGGILFERTDTYSRGSLHFATNNDANSGDVDLTDVRMTILKDGNVGIGTTTPTGKLEVTQSGTPESARFLRTNADTNNPTVEIQTLQTTNERVELGRYKNAIGTNYFYRNLASGSTAGPVVNIVQDNTGNTHPSLRVQQDGTGGGLLIENAGGTNSFVITHNTDDSITTRFIHSSLWEDADNGAIFVLNDGTNTEKIRFDSRDSYDSWITGGNVGIGTTAPNKSLHVYGGGIKVEATTFAEGSFIEFLNTAHSNAISDFVGQRSWYDRRGISIGDGTNDYLFVETSGGNVGIGTTSPGYLLDIKASSANQDLLRLSHPGSPADAGFMIGFNTDGVSDNTIISLGVEYGSTDYDVLNIERSTRNVGIGTTTPDTTLHVVGDLTVEGNINVTGCICYDGGATCLGTCV